MARARNIKPALFKNEILGVADPMLTLLFEGLWLLADRAGRLEDRPLRIKGELFPYRDGVCVDEMLDWLYVEGFIVRYQASGKSFIEITNFTKHQNPHKNEPDSTIPSPEKIGTTSEFIGTGTENIGSTRADSLSLDSLNLIPDSLTTAQAQDELGPKDGFATFWSRYPKKKAKPAAEKAWKKINPDHSLFNKIMESLGKHCVSKEWLKDDGQFIPHPATWLNQARWEDEVTLANNVHKFPGQSRHTGFDERDYTNGLTDKGDGTYVF